MRCVCEQQHLKDACRFPLLMKRMRKGQSLFNILNDRSSKIILNINYLNSQF